MLLGFPSWLLFGMYKSSLADVAKGIGVDAIIWFSAPIIFLFFFVRYSVTSTAAIAPHLLIVLLVFLLFCALRSSLALLLKDEHVARNIAALLYAPGLILQFIYYPLVIIGLNAWGQVISWALIHSYALQAPDLADALGIPLSLTLAALGGCALIIFGVIRWQTGRWDWPRAMVSSARERHAARALGLALAGLMGIPLIMLILVFYFPNRDTSEPIITTFFPKGGVTAFRGFALDAKAGEKFDRENDAARAAYQPNPTASKRNLILIVVDALRPDHMSIYGYGRDTTPHLKNLANASDVNMRLAHGTRAVCSESACGLFAIASSKYFHEVSARPFTIQQALRAHGYEVRMILGGDHTNFYGLRDLYGNVDSYIDGSDPSAKYANGDRWVLAKSAELPEWSGKPTMIQFHLMSAHPLAQREPEFTKFLPTSSYVLTHIGKKVETEHAVNFYDNGVLQADDILHKLLQTLRAKKYLDNALVVITADHGDALGEHGLYTHANGVREAVIRIPLILLSYGYVPPALPDTRAATSQIDIAPTILSEFGMPLPPVWRGSPLHSAQKAHIQYMQQGDEIGLIDLRHPPAIWKYWFKGRTGQEFAYDVASDPGEHHNAIGFKERVSPELAREWRMRTRQMRMVAEGR
jgi:glucan phosphoethanolaminetransferase (alkaline phosphatase superfamily)